MICIDCSVQVEKSSSCPTSQEHFPAVLADAARGGRYTKSARISGRCRAIHKRLCHRVISLNVLSARLQRAVDTCAFWAVSLLHVKSGLRVGSVVEPGWEPGVAVPMRTVFLQGSVRMALPCPETVPCSPQLSSLQHTSIMLNRET